jgi:acyl-coenzyme A thioesterase PaaI-like protein
MTRMALTWQSLGGDHRLLRLGLNLWPPFAAAGIRVEHLSADYRTVRVVLHHRCWARNYVGTHFGGSLFAMTDPFWMLMVLRNLGPDYVVWDKAAEIDFVAPGRSRVRAGFALTEGQLADLRAAADRGEKVLRWFETDVVAEDGTVVARVRKQVYVRRRRPVSERVGS